MVFSWETLWGGSGYAAAHSHFCVSQKNLTGFQELFFWPLVSSGVFTSRASTASAPASGVFDREPVEAGLPTSGVDELIGFCGGPEPRAPLGGLVAGLVLRNEG